MMKIADWSYIEELASRKRSIDFDVLRDEVDAIPNQKLLHSFGPLLYQRHLYALVRIFRPSVVVETGVRYGVGSTMILRALEVNGAGHLFSCDPMHAGPREAMESIVSLTKYDLGFKRWTFLSGTSNQRMGVISDLVPSWGMFVHDSDHSSQNMSWELEYAIAHVNPGGVIVCDDWNWPDPDDVTGTPHRALERFCEKYLLDFHTVGTAAVVEI